LAAPASALARDVSASSLLQAQITGLTHTEGIARVGDVNGDGRADVAIGDYNAVRVVFAPRAGWRGTIDVRHLGPRGFTIKGAPGSGAGLFLDGAGDFNGDGLRDVLVVSLFVYADEFGGTYDPNQRPQFWIAFGKRDTKTIDLTRPAGHARRIELPLGGTGTAAGLGDVNGDRFDDVVIAQSYGNDGLTPGAYVVFGGRGSAPVDLARSGWPGFFIKTPGHYWVWGSVEAAGDQNGDRLADVAVGPAGGKPTDIVFGKRSRTPVDTSRLGGAGFKLPSVDLAWQVGDVNGDGRTDLLSFANVDFKGRRRAGAGFVLFGRGVPTRLDVTKRGPHVFEIGGRIGEKGCRPAPDADIIDCAVEHESLGPGTSVGDLNGDGLGDLAVATRANRIYVVHGSRVAGALDLAAPGNGAYAITAPRTFTMSEKVAWIGGRTLAVLGNGRHGQRVLVLGLRG
jgi:hypothetical protein